MTLIISILTPRGAVLAADRRTIATPNKGGEKFVLSDSTTKILVGQDIAIAVLGNQSNGPLNSARMIELWIKKDYRPSEPLQDQLKNLYHNISEKLPRSSIIAVRYQVGRAESYEMYTEAEPVYTSITSNEIATLRPYGSGVEVATKFIDLYRPPLATLDLQKLVDYSAFLIRTTHGLQYFGSAAEPSVGGGVSAAVCDSTGAQMVVGRSYVLDDISETK